MREDIDFDIIDTYIEENLDDLEWETENPIIQFSFNLALESLRDHEIDRCVWTLKKAVETSKDGEGFNHAIYQLLVCTELYPEALEVLGEAIEKEFEDPYIIHNYAYCLYGMNEIDKAEKHLAIQLVGDEGELSNYRLSLLSSIRTKQGIK